MQRVVKSHGYIHIVRIGGCERYLELGNEVGMRGVCWTLVFFCVALIAQAASICHLKMMWTTKNGSPAPAGEPG